MVIALCFAYLLPIIALSLTLLNLNTLLLNLKSEFINIKSIFNLKNNNSNSSSNSNFNLKFNTITLSTLISVILRTLSLYIYWFPDSLNTRIRPLAYPLIEIFNNIALLFIAVTVIQFIIYLKDYGLKHMSKSVLVGVTFALSITPIIFLILKVLKNIIPDSILLDLVCILEVI